jgi:hypothetical protein
MKTLKLAFLAPVIRGHANIHFTIFHYLLTEPRTDDLHLDIHIISDEPQRKRFSTLPSSPHATLTFHAMGDEDMHMAFHSGVRVPPLSVAYTNGIRMMHVISDLLYPPPAVYISRVHRITQVLEDVRPDLFVVDTVVYDPGGVGIEGVRDVVRSDQRRVAWRCVCSVDECIRQSYGEYRGDRRETERGGSVRGG